MTAVVSRPDTTAALAVPGTVTLRSTELGSGAGTAGGLTVVVDERWDSGLLLLPAPAGPVLPVYGIGGALVVGPLVAPGRTGCPACVALRVRAAWRPDGAVATDAPTPLSARAGRPWSPLSLRLVAAVLRAEADRLAAGAEPLSRHAVLRVDVHTRSAHWHPVVPHVACPAEACTSARRPLPPALPRPGLRLPATRPTGGRRFPLAAYAGSVTERHVDDWCGVVTRPAIAAAAALPAVQAAVPTRWDFRETAIGHADNLADARTAAALEGLERYAGWHSGGRRPAAFAAFEDLDTAVDPRSLLLHDADAYRSPEFGYVPFDPRLPVSWALAHLATTGQPVMLPFHVAYYGAAREAGLGPSFVYENSNGCAVGAGPEEALLHGLLEVVERDAFLRTWYARTPLPELALTDAPPAVRTLAVRTGRQLRAFQAVGEFGLPVVLLVSSSDDPDLPATLVTAGCALDTESALSSAAHEMACVSPAITARYADARAELPALLADPRRVRHMTDHALVAAAPEARQRFAFLLDRPDWTPAGRPAHVPRGDIGADLAALLAAGTAAGHQVLVVDHTTPELHEAGLSCVKAVVPGTVPMTFGHTHRRLPDLVNLNTFRQRHGAPPVAEVNDDPHPFP